MEVKFRYVYKNKETGEIKFEYFTLKDIEEMETSPEFYYCDFDMYDLIARYVYTNQKDDRGAEIYEVIR